MPEGNQHFGGSFEVEDFSGGKTDYYLGANPSKCQEADNLLILKHGTVGKIFTRPGSEIYDETYYQIPVGSQRIGRLIYFGDTLFYFSATKMYYIDGTGWHELVGPVDFNPVFPGATVNDTISYSFWNNHLYLATSQYNKPHKVYFDDVGNEQMRTATLEQPAAATITGNPKGPPGENYLYRYLFRYEYKVGTVTHIDRGPSREGATGDVFAPDVSPINFTNIPVISNGATESYDVNSSLLRVEIYRTTDDGTNFFLVGSVPNGTTVFADTMSDTTLLTQEPLYTEDGSVENEPSPPCAHLHIMDDRGYFGGVKEGTEFLNNRLRQSIPGDPDSSPGTFFVDLQEDIKGLSSVTSSPIVLCENLIYRIDGAFDGLGVGAMIAEIISDTAGCISANSVVQTLNGLYWAGNDGFYFTDGYRVAKVSEDIDETYQTFIDTAEKRRRIQGVYDPKKNRIWWTAQVSDSVTDCDSCFILDLNWGIQPSMPFTTASGGEEDNFSPTSLTFIGENLIRGDRRGYTFEHKESVYSDPLIDTGSAPATWDVTTIVFNYTSAATNFGTAGTRKFVPRININCKNVTNLSLQIVSINDDSRRIAELAPIRFRGNITWGDPDVYWGDPSTIWGYAGLVDEQRRFPAKNLRCQYKQVKLTNAKVVIISSDLIGTVTSDRLAKTATLDDPASFDWPDAMLDYLISFSDDNYTKEFKVVGRTADVLTYEDSAGIAPDVGGLEWVIRGKPKDEVMQLTSYAMSYRVFGKTSPLFRSSATGELS